MYVITAEVKCFNSSDYVKSFLNANGDWINESENDTMIIYAFSTLEDAEFIKSIIINRNNPVIRDVKNIKIQRIELFDIS